METTGPNAAFSLASAVRLVRSRAACVLIFTALSYRATPANSGDPKLSALQHAMLTIIASGDVRDCFLAADLGDTRPNGEGVSALRRSIIFERAGCGRAQRLDAWRLICG